MSNYNQQITTPDKQTVQERKPRRAINLLPVKIVLAIVAIWIIFAVLNLFLHFLAWGVQWFFWGALAVAVLFCLAPFKKNKYKNTAIAFVAGVVTLAVVLLLMKIF